MVSELFRTFINKQAQPNIQQIVEKTQRGKNSSTQPKQNIKIYNTRCVEGVVAIYHHRRLNCIASFYLPSLLLLLDRILASGGTSSPSEER
jgi:hypothetical protein